MSNLIKFHSPLVALLLTCVLIVLSSGAVFASEVSTFPSEAPSFEIVIPEEYKDPVYDKLASESGGSRALHTIDDVYNLLAQQFGLSTDAVSSGYIWSRMAGYLKILGLNINGSNSEYAMSLRDIIAHQFPSASVSNTQYGLAYYLGNGSFITSAEMQFVISNTLSRHFSGTNGNYIDVYLANLQSYVNSIRTILTNDTNTKIDNISKINWSNVSSSYFGAAQTPGGSYVSSGWFSDLYFSFTLPGSDSFSPQCFRFFVPVTPAGTNNSHVAADIASIKIWVNNNLLTTSGDVTYYLEPTTSGTYVYVFGFNRAYTSGTYFLEIKTSDNSTYYYNSSNSLSVSSVDFDTYDYQLLKSAFVESESASALSDLADYLVDPAKKQAEEASQAVIDDTLDGFTGNGSAAAKVNDTTSMKNISGSVRSGLDSGAGVSNATSVFNLNSGFWGWFSQSNSDAINNAYPAPSVPQLRGSGDYVVDFLSGNQSDLEDLLGGAEW